ncbi:MAG: hypothetical protein IPM14_05595 [bacterium]|nr:hypothetical protein [bacterium]
MNFFTQSSSNLITLSNIEKKNINEFLQTKLEGLKDPVILKRIQRKYSTVQDIIDLI